MTVKGLDRVVIGVRDFDAALGFFSKKLGLEITEIKGSQVEAIGERAGWSVDGQVEIISPVYPLKETTAPHIKKLAGMLEEKDAVLFAVGFKVDDTKAAAHRLEGKGIPIRGVMEAEEFPELSIGSMRQLVTDEEDTLGLFTVFIDYERT